MSSAAKTTAAGQQARPVAGLGTASAMGCGSQTGRRAVSGLPGTAEAGARDRLRLALAKRDLLVGDLAQAETAANRAQEMAWDREAEVEKLEASAKKRRSGVGGGDERALVESILSGGVAPIEKKEPPDPELERLRTEADALRAAAARLKGHLPRRREGVPALRSIMSFWIPIAHSTAATTEGNSISSPSPVVFDDVAALARDERSRRRAMLAHHPRRPHP